MSKEEDQIEGFLVKNTSGIVSLEFRYFIFDNCSFVSALKNQLQIMLIK